MTFLDVLQAAAFLGVSEYTIRDYARRGLVPASKIGKSWQFRERELFQGYPDNAIPAGSGQFQLIPLAGLPLLPQIFDHRDKQSGVYFLWCKDQLRYIGSSCNVLVRFRQHKKRGKVEFDRANYLPIRFPWYLAVEAAYIQAYLPPENILHTPRASRCAS